MIILLCFIWIIFSVIMYKRSKKDFRFSEALLPLILINLVVTIALGVNAIGHGYDGIAINNFLAYSVIGEDGWSRELFFNYFEESLNTDLFLIITYMVLKVFKK